MMMEEEEEEEEERDRFYAWLRAWEQSSLEEEALGMGIEAAEGEAA
jgi:hypothetical protein